MQIEIPSDMFWQNVINRIRFLIARQVFLLFCVNSFFPKGFKKLIDLFVVAPFLGITLSPRGNPTE